MGCANCAINKGGLPAGCQNNGTCATGGCNKLNTYDWLSNVQYMDEPEIPPVVEVKFKGTRKGFFRNKKKFDLEIGDFVVVDSPSGGYDVGHVSLRSELVKLQMKKYKVDSEDPQMLTIQRKAGDQEMEKLREGRNKENDVMIESRKIARALGLEMKISDVEYQADLSKATFYYTAEGRVDFRELIKKLAGKFKLKVEMKQIGLRQEAGRLGGIGSCGRELCCSTWLTDFNTVPTSAARYQNLFINPMKLAGQCGRLKCCLNYELDTYLEALENFPDENTIIQSQNGPLIIVKTDILRNLVWLQYKKPTPEVAGIMVPFNTHQIDVFIKKSKQGDKIPPLEDYAEKIVDLVADTSEYSDILGEENISRFDDKNKNRSGSNKKRRSKNQKGRQGRNQKN